MSSTTLKVFCIFIVFSLSSSGPVSAHALASQQRVENPSLTPKRTHPEPNTPPSSSELFELQQEKRERQQLQWQQQQEQWRDRQDLNFQQQYSQQQQELDRQMEIRLRAQ